MRRQLAPLVDRHAERRKRHGIESAADPQLDPSATQDVHGRGILCEAQRVLQRNGHDGGAEADTRGVLATAARR